MGFSDLLEEIGGFGRFQFIHVTLLSIPGLLMATQNLLNNFTAGTPRHHCASANHTELAAERNLSESSLWRVLIPETDGGTGLSRCSRYRQPQWHLLTGNISNTTAPETEPCLDGWTYDRTEFEATIVSEFDLVCTLRPLKQLCQTIYMGGVLAGAIIFGVLSDRFGRKAVLIWCYLQLATTGTCTAFSSSYVAYCTLRFLTGMSVSGIILNTNSLCMEWVSTKSRTFVGSITSFSFTFSQMILAGVAYSIPDWRKLHVAFCVPFFVFFIYSWWHSESARWLVLNRRTGEALKHIHQVARMNGKSEMVEKITVEVLESHMHKEVELSKSVYTAYDLLRTPTLRRISIFMMIVWFSTSFAYYGLSLDLQKFGVSIYLIQLIFAVVDFPAKVFALAGLNFLGRRITQGTSLLLSGIVIFVNILVPEDLQTIRTTMAVLGRGFTAASFTCLYVYTAEVNPTVIRQTGFGLSLTMARVGSMAAPAVLILEEILPALPSIVYGSAAVVAGICGFFLPETLNIPLPDTIEDVEEMWGRPKPLSREMELLVLQKKNASSENSAEIVVEQQGIC